MSDSFETIATFTYSSEAQIIKGRLEADGIDVFLSDNFTIDTDPLVSNAIGGVKLRVKTEDVEKAKALLKSIEQYSVDEEGNPIICPNCSKAEVKMYSTVKDFKSFFSFILGLIVGTLPFSARYRYKCDNCNYEFDIK